MIGAPERTIAVAEIGGTSIKVGFAENSAPSPFSRTYPTGRLHQAPPIGELASMLVEAAAEAGLAPSTLVATVPGFVDRDFDTVLHAANVPELNGLQLASELKQALGLPVVLERDVVLQLLGESAAGAVRGRCEVLAIYLGTGIGAAYLGEHGIFRGGGWALEIGHMPVLPFVDEHPLLPKRIENYAAGVRLVELATEHAVAVGDVFAASQGLPSLGRSLDQVIWQQAIAIASATVMYSPRTVLLGGGVVDIYGYPRPLLEQRVGICLPLSTTVQPFDIRWASLGWQAAIHGAISLTSGAGPTQSSSVRSA